MEKIRQFLKSSIGAALYYSGLLSLYSYYRRMLDSTNKLTIVTYHRILDDKEHSKAFIQPGMCVTRENFYKQMQYLYKNYHILSLDDLLIHLDSNKPFLLKSAMVTFDDGWHDNYRYAFPVLKQYNIPAIVFLATDMIESSELPAFLDISLLLGELAIWPDIAVSSFLNVVNREKLLQSYEKLDKQALSLIRINPANYMTKLMILDNMHIKMIANEIKILGGIDNEEWESKRWMLNKEEIIEMKEAGITFGSHGKTHEIMLGLNSDQIRRELFISKRIIKGIIRQPVESFSYPNNDFNEEIKKIVKEENYRCAFAGSDPQKNPYPDRYSLKRININEGAVLDWKGKFSKALFACRLEKLI